MHFYLYSLSVRPAAVGPFAVEPNQASEIYWLPGGAELGGHGEVPIGGHLPAVVSKVHFEPVVLVGSFWIDSTAPTAARGRRDSGGAILATVELNSCDVCWIGPRGQGRFLDRGRLNVDVVRKAESRVDFGDEG